jgi:hypothetical protein
MRIVVKVSLCTLLFFGLLSAQQNMSRSASAKRLAASDGNNKTPAFGTIVGQVMDTDSNDPLIGTNIVVVGIGIGAATTANGRYKILNVPAGEYSIEFSYIGYESKTIDHVSVKQNDEIQLNIKLQQRALELKEIIVTPGQFAIMGKEPVVRQTLTREDLQTITFGEDIYRAISRLPGISSNDFSARFTVRGGENEEILVLLDGMELYEPFHLKDIDGGALSIIDADNIEGIDLFTGGFPAEYGDRTSGVFNIRSTEPNQGTKRTSLGISFMNARLMSEGTFGDEKGSYMVSARRGYLDLVLDIMGEVDPPRPTYYDIFSKVKYNVHRKHSLTASFLRSGDKLEYVEDDNDMDNTKYGNTYGWLTLKSMISPKLYIQSMASLGRITHSRNGLGYLGDTDVVNYDVADENSFNLYGFKQDWNLEFSDSWYLKWGYDYKYLDASYDYFNAILTREYSDPQNYTDTIDTTLVRFKPIGNQFGAYLSNRFRVVQPLTAEIAMRYDRNSFSGDDLLSPRINFVYSVGKQTFLRAGWGYFYQSEGIHEVRVNEGESQFYPATLAKHWVAGFEHTFENNINFRLEGYYKKLSNLRPDYRNWSNVIEVFPEVQDDRFGLNFNGATAKGVEVYLKYDKGGKFSWWASYALADAEEDIRSIVYRGQEYTAGAGEYPGRYDQRHSIYLDMNYRPNRSWHFYVSWQYHSGWPYTPLVLRSGQNPNGSIYYYSTYEDYNGANFSAYHRLDVRLNRHFYLSKGRLSMFLALINLYNRGNVRNINYDWVWSGPSNTPHLEEVYDYWFKLLPSIGISWSWNH